MTSSFVSQRVFRGAKSKKWTVKVKSLEKVGEATIKVDGQTLRACTIASLVQQERLAKYVVISDGPAASRHD